MVQDRYVGDIGDFAKYVLLRAVFEGAKLGIAWYLHPEESDSTDGRHTVYLERSEEWRWIDEDLFDESKKIVASCRSVAAVQDSSVLPHAVFADERLNVNDVAVSRRASWRRAWFGRVRQRLENCDVIFADPDNGLIADSSFRPTLKRSAKSTPMQELVCLSERRPMVVYHHNSRRKGGHRKEIDNWLSVLPRKVFAYYWR